MNPSVKRCLPYVFFCLLTLQACKQDTETTTGEDLATTVQTAVTTYDDIPLGQLPKHVVPINYRLALKIFPQLEAFSGEVTIDIDIQKPGKHFYLHGKNLEVYRVLLTLDGESFEGRYEQVDDTGIARITSPRSLQGKVKVDIDYKAPFNQSLHGLYKVVESDRHYAFTQFEAISARLAFPGFDEPRFKTPFEIELIIPEGQVAITNTPEVSRRSFDGMTVIHFAPTKALPTYLIAFAVGELDVVEWPDLPPTEIRRQPLKLRGIAVKGKGGQLDYALAGTEAILTALERYFGTPYPWAKLDIIAVPDFAAGAMENVGAITYRESLLLFDENATPARQRSYKMVHAHELAHQWFGNLVTPAWWNDIWLNEAFATWMAHVAMDMAEPDGNYRRDLLSRGLTVMNGDSLVNARKIRQPILSNDDISTAFDGITYSKGGAVLSMFEQLLGRDNFRQGVNNYLQEFAYGVATADDFIRHLAESSESHSRELVIEAFNSFLEQPGLPLVSIETACKGGTATVQMKQSRYFPLGSGGNRDQTWKIPVCMKVGSGDEISKTCLMLTKEVEQFELTPSCPDWIMPNADSAGYYRFTMAEADWSTLLANSRHLDTNEMMATLGSLAGVFDSGEVDIATLMSLAPDLIDSPDWQVATEPMKHMKFMYDRLADDGQKEELASRFSGFYSEKLDETGLEKTSDRDRAQLQSALVTFMAETARQKDLRTRLVGMAKDYTGYETDRQVHPEAANPVIIRTALRVAVDELGHDFVDHLRDLALASTDAVVRGHTLSAIAHVKDAEKAAEVLELVFSEQIRDNEIFTLLYPQTLMNETRERTWEWFKQNMDRILPRVPETAWGRMTFVGAAFCDEDKRKEVDAFFSERINNMTGGPRNLAKNLERIELCVAKVKAHKAGMDEWLGQ
jgi:alanyl aminopeptidase